MGSPLTSFCDNCLCIFHSNSNQELNFSDTLDNEPLSKHGSPEFRYMKRNIDFIEKEIKNLKGGFTNLLECTMIVENLSLGTENKIKDSVGSCKVPPHNLNVSDKSDIHSAKIIRPCELPQLFVCYKDDAKAVKDICVDEEVFVKDKITVKNEKDKGGHIKIPCDGNKFNFMTKEHENEEFLSPDGSLQSSESDYDNDSQEINCSLENTLVCDITSGEANCSPTNKNVVVESHAEALSPDFGSQKTLMSFLLSSDYNGNEFDQHTNKNGIPVSGLADNGKLDYTTTASELNKLSYNGDDEAQQGQEDFSSGRINCSGPMLIYSGSISIRSESSSTRSFAFPILQPEWHASPVKMAKPDRRKYRKHGGWKQALACCRF